VHILADRNIPLVREAFGCLGEVTLYPGRRLSREQVAGADILLVRSVTPVNAALLEGSRVRFVGTATIGTDHVDQAYLARRGVGFASAPGSNANSVAEYLTAALLELADAVLPGRTLRGLTLGIIGAGNVGRRVEEKARALGLDVLLNDPPLARATGLPKYRPLEELFRADVLTLHVPLTREGPDATHHLADARFFERMREGAVFINTSRGAVADTAALSAALDSGRLAAAVLDVWEGEPDIPADLLSKVFIGTPHIAGYSYDGKVNGTRMIFEAACRHFGLDLTWDPSGRLPEPAPAVIPLGDLRGEAACRAAVRVAYDIRRDDTALRETLNLPPGERGAAFDRLRKEYPVRREFAAFTVTGGAEDDRRLLQRLGFRLG